MRSPHSLLALAGLLLGACTYDFQNPAEKLDTGEVTGRVVADTGGGPTGIGGVSVRLRNSSADLAVAQLSRDNGRFVLLGLQPGRHTVLFSKENAELETTWAITRDVEIGWGADGQPEGVLLGDIQIRYPVTIGGSFSVPAAAISNGFVPYPGAVFAYDDATGARAIVTPAPDGFTSIATFDYTFQGLPVGPHRLRFVVTGSEWGLPVTYVLGPISKDVAPGQEGQEIPMNPLTLAAPAVGTGKLRFEVSAPPSLASPYAWTISIAPTPTPLDPAPAAIGCPSASCTLTSDGTAEADLGSGAYTVSVTTTPADFTYYDPPPVLGIVTAGQTTELGTLYITDYAVAAEAVGACLFDADCGTGMACSGGQCTWDLPACLSGDFSVECLDWDLACIQPPYTTTSCSGGRGVCAWGPGPGGFVCVPNGASGCISGGEPFPIQPPICGP